MNPISDNLYTLEVSITKTNQITGKTEHSAVVKSHNLTLAETVDMQKPLLAVLNAWVEQDAE